MSITLQTGEKRLDFDSRGERCAGYHYGQADLPGFSELFAPGQRAVTQTSAHWPFSIWVAHGAVDGVAFDRPEAREDNRERGRIVSLEMSARRSPMSVGFQQKCDWLAPDGRKLLTEVRTVRIAPGPAEGFVLDWTLHFSAPEERPVTLGATAEGFLVVRPAKAMLSANGGQIRDGAGNEGLEALHGRSAPWCACVGVVQGETVGFTLHDHPDNPDYPAPWVARPEGLLSPGGFAWRTTELRPRAPLALRYRMLVHRGYVEARWPAERHAEFTHPPV